MAILGAILFALLVIGVPIGISLAGSTAILVLFDDFLQFSTLFEAFFNFISKYTLIAIPFFIFAGFLMERTGLVRGLFDFADALIGWVPGGFAYATLMAAADGDVDDDEKEVLQQIVEHFGLAPDSMQRLLKWTSQGYVWMQKGYDILNEISE